MEHDPYGDRCAASLVGPPVIDVTWRDILLRWPDHLSVVLDHDGVLVLWAGTGRWSRREVTRAMETARPRAGWHALVTASPPPPTPAYTPGDFSVYVIHEERAPGSPAPYGKC